MPVFSSIGDFEKTVHHFNLQISTAKDARDKAEEGRAYAGLGIAFHFRGNVEKAIDYIDYNLRLNIAKEL